MALPPTCPTPLKRDILLTHPFVGSGAVVVIPAAIVMEVGAVLPAPQPVLCPVIRLPWLPLPATGSMAVMGDPGAQGDPEGDPDIWVDEGTQVSEKEPRHLGEGTGSSR